MVASGKIRDLDARKLVFLDSNENPERFALHLILIVTVRFDSCSM